MRSFRAPLFVFLISTAMKQWRYQNHIITKHNVNIFYVNGCERAVINVPSTSDIYKYLVDNPEAIKQPIYGEYVNVKLPTRMIHIHTRRIIDSIRVFVRYLYDAQYDKYHAVESPEQIAANIVYANYQPVPA